MNKYGLYQQQRYLELKKSLKKIEREDLLKKLVFLLKDTADLILDRLEKCRR